MISKMKNHETKTVKILAEQVIKPLINAVINGIDVKSQFRNYFFKCPKCPKDFTSSKKLRNPKDSEHASDSIVSPSTSPSQSSGTRSCAQICNKYAS